MQPEKPIRSGLPGRLLPLIRNLISNTVIVGANLSVSSVLAASSLHFLVVIHKLEYFAHVGVMGGQIRCTGMGTFGGHADHGSRVRVSGLVTAPIYYAYLKNELAARKLI